jgi:hypothetical protein
MIMRSLTFHLCEEVQTKYCIKVDQQKHDDPNIEELWDREDECEEKSIQAF